MIFINNVRFDLLRLMLMCFCVFLMVCMVVFDRCRCVIIFLVWWCLILVLSCRFLSIYGSRKLLNSSEYRIMLVVRKISRLCVGKGVCFFSSSGIDIIFVSVMVLCMLESVVMLMSCKLNLWLCLFWLCRVEVKWCMCRLI